MHAYGFFSGIIRLFQSSGSTDLLFNKVWDPEAERCVGMLEGRHTDRLTTLCWHSKHEVLVTGSLDGAKSGSRLALVIGTALLYILLSSLTVLIFSFDGIHQ